jgi:hypothetical protein
MNLNNSEIGFDHFTKAFYNNKNNTKMVLELTLDIEDDVTNYDIHIMLLQLFFIGIIEYSIPFEQMQTYFDNINIKIYAKNFTKKQLIDDNSGYANRYMRVDNDMNMLKNGSHDENLINELKDIKSFHTNNDNYNLCIYFDHNVC